MENLTEKQLLLLGFVYFASRPIQRLAYEIKVEDNLDWNEETKEATITIAASDLDNPASVFACFQKPVVGDYVVFLKDEDIYHVARDVFVERNVMPEDCVRDGSVTARSFNPSQNPVVDGIKERIEALAEYIKAEVPACRRRSISLTHLETASMYAVKANFYSED